MRKSYSQPIAVNYSLQTPEQNPLFEAAKNGDLSFLKHHIKTLEALDVRDTQGQSLTKIAIQHNQNTILNWFYEEIIFPFYTHEQTIFFDKHDFKQRTIIHWAAKCNLEKAIFDDFIKEGAFIDRADNPFQVTPLYLAVQDTALRAIRALIDVRANVNATAINGATPLHAAAESGHLEIIKTLITAKANVNKPCSQNGTPLFIAIKKGYLQAVQLLIESGANLEIAYNHEITPLVLAMQYNHIEIVKVLLSAKAKTDYTLSNGWDLKQLAQELKNPRLVDLFNSTGVSNEAQN